MSAPHATVRAFCRRALIAGGVVMRGMQRRGNVRNMTTRVVAVQHSDLDFNLHVSYHHHAQWLHFGESCYAPPARAQVRGVVAHVALLGPCRSSQ